MRSTDTYDEWILDDQETDLESELPAEAALERVRRIRRGGYYQSSGRKTYRIIWFLAFVLEMFIGFRIFLKVIGANPQAGFASFVYALTAPFLAPFAGLVSSPSAHGSILEITSVIALLVYFLFFWLVSYAFLLFRNR